MEKARGVSGFWYLLGGAAVGAAAGVLLAPKKGSEMRKDLSRFIPARVKVAAEKTREFVNP